MKLNAVKQMEHLARCQPGAVSLSQGIPFRASDDAIRETVFAAINDGKVDSYADPQGLLELRQLISQKLADDHMEYGPNEVIVTAGAIEALSATLLSILTHDHDEVIIPTPTYSAYFKAVAVAKGRAISVRLNEDDGWALDLEKIEASISSKTGAILICNPNNPTGNIYPPEVLDALCDMAKKRGILLILDEVYKNMLFDATEWYAPTSRPEYKDTVVRIVSFSKDFALSGWRVGFLHTSSRLVEKILPVHDALVNCTPVISQYAAIASLHNQTRIYQQNRDLYTKNRDIMASYLDQISDMLSYQMPQGSYFFFPKFKTPINTDEFCLQLFKDQHVTVVPGSDFGPGGEGHLRLCFGRSEEAIHKGMQGLVQFLTDAA